MTSENQDSHNTIETNIAITKFELERYSEISNDFNPIHTDAIYASKTIYQKQIIQGNLVISKFTGLIATNLPGPGSVIVQQSARFINPIFVNQEIVLKLSVTKEIKRANLFYLEGICTDEENKKLMEASFKVHVVEVKG